MATHHRRRFGGILCTLGIAAALPVSAHADPSPPEPSSAYVDVAAATVWTSPQSPRPVDAPALTNPVDLRRWLADMTLAQQEALTSDNLTQTQAVYGDRVYVLQEQGDWDEVAVAGQPTPKNSLGYPGWIPKAQLTTNPIFAALKDNRPFAQADLAATTSLFEDSGLSRPALEISAGTRLPVLAQIGGAIAVAIPDGPPKWLDANTVHVYQREADIPYPTGDDLVRFGSLFLDRPYLWGGRSGFGMDCSGFTSTIYQVNGITLPRDAAPQAMYGNGRPVDQNQLRAGDLLFYADDLKDPNSIYHVAMYIGEQRMIEAFDAATPVRITPVRFGPNYWGAERYLRS
ncbi:MULTISPECIES: C40 family peptidase [unclassified Nocardia]|uniref:C40 family peptidase n=1 Tax=unclassified Nocardia TaxID=2637762 RepID=UPI001CE422C2|nr:MULTISPECIES: C40 family peptidase [unclassified Nocardia]